MPKCKDFAGLAVLWIVLMLGLGVLFAGIEMWLWNQVMPDLFGLKQITFWQALCISWLCMMLIKAVPMSSSKGDEYLEGIRALSARQEILLERIRELQDLQLDAMGELKGSLQGIGDTLERQR